MENEWVRIDEWMEIMENEWVWIDEWMEMMENKWVWIDEWMEMMEKNRKLFWFLSVIEHKPYWLRMRRKLVWNEKMI